MKNKTKFQLKLLDWLCIIAGIAISILTVFVDHDHSLVYIIASLFMLNCGVAEMILLVNGRRSNYVFTMLCAIASIWVAFIDQFYGNTVINFFYVIISIIGFYSWGKHSDKDKTVIARRLTTKQIIFLSLALVVSSIGLDVTLRYFGGHSTVSDSVSTILIIFASVLGVLRYREQWITWILADILLLAMWLPIGSPAVIALRVFFLLSSTYGYFNWRKLIKNNKNTK